MSDLPRVGILAERLGAAGRERVAGLSWSPVVRELLGG